MLKKTLGCVGTWIAIAALLGGCRDPGPGAPTTPAQTASGGPGSATLSWEAPTTNTNGTALTDLAGYRIYYGPSAEQLDQSVDAHVPTTGNIVDRATRSPLRGCNNRPRDIGNKRKISCLIAIADDCQWLSGKKLG